MKTRRKCFWRRSEESRLLRHKNRYFLRQIHKTTLSLPKRPQINQFVSIGLKQTTGHLKTIPNDNSNAVRISTEIQCYRNNGRRALDEVVDSWQILDQLQTLLKAVDLDTFGHCGVIWSSSKPNTKIDICVSSILYFAQHFRSILQAWDYACTTHECPKYSYNSYTATHEC